MLVIRYATGMNDIVTIFFFGTFHLNCIYRQFNEVARGKSLKLRQVIIGFIIVACFNDAIIGVACVGAVSQMYQYTKQQQNSI